MSLRAAAIALLLLAAARPAGAAALERAPALRGHDLRGAVVDLDSLRTRGPVVVTFWATWCKPCRHELPALAAVVRAAGDSVALIAVNEDGPRGRAQAVAAWRSFGAPGHAMPDDDGSLAERFLVAAFPSTFVVAPDGSVVYAKQGYRAGEEKAVVEAVIRAAGRR